MINRVKQFILAITAHLSEEDISYSLKYLNKEEWVLFNQLKEDEKKHSIRVAQKLALLSGGNVELIKVGLLHDIGKTVVPLTIREKVLMVALDKITHGRIAKKTQLKMVKGYYKHPLLGYYLLKSKGDYTESFLYLIKEHHTKQEEKNIYLQWLQQADDEN